MTTQHRKRSHPHRLDLYRWSVQHPQAETAFLLRAYARHNPGRPPQRLKEDFAGTAAVATAWVQRHETHRALAVESHEPTICWAHRRAQALLGHRAGDLLFLQADVLEVNQPKVDLVAALNFSVLVYHTRPALTRYFRHARRSLRPGGLLVLDVFGGPGAMRTDIQRRTVRPLDADESIPPFTYEWEQRSFDALTGRIDCRIHFDLPGRRLNNAFRYDWRLWTLPELLECLEEAGFSRTEVWCDRYDPRQGHSDGIYRPIKSLPAREDWVAYVVGCR